MTPNTSPIIIRIDWADLDLFGHVNNVAFFKYIQAARVNFCEQVGFTSLNESNKPGFMVASSQCQFKKPLLYPGTVTVQAQAGWIKNSSFQLLYQLINQNGDLCAEGEDVLVAFDYTAKTKITVPEPVRNAIEKMEKEQ